MLVIEYDPKDKSNLIPDAEIDWFVKRHIEQYIAFTDMYGDFNQQITVSQELIVLRFRVAIVKQEIKYTEIGFMYNNELLLPFPAGTFKHWPTGFCELSTNYLAAMVSRRKEI